MAHKNGTGTVPVEPCTEVAFYCVFNAHMDESRPITASSVWFQVLNTRGIRGQLHPQPHHIHADGLDSSAAY
ncbi:uncharacterized protein ANIA_10143 [Aspergillus nidulans FGSC A4]|uniref:Uncharacterized protein n=1 Tax=Emericella nidulans (strain FGSC A4 / ATCC 38163 / CBS 112.46 / NRRL 194 / M139) TaxID=227321 RepID=C8VU58_EMENI|nr:hypothetical protein [Aspergillus nidulans FGSC A4]CBF88347.1 TPA: hypothetical protein ANIA_10143 [Aspergillus nidulans FGSC A4]